MQQGLDALCHAPVRQKPMAEWAKLGITLPRAALLVKRDCHKVLESAAVLHCLANRKVLGEPRLCARGE